MGNLAASAVSAISSLLSSPDQYPAPATKQSGLSLAWPSPSGAIMSVRFDVVTSEAHEALMSITDHPVEVGANVADNARELPTTIAIEAFITNVPMASNPVIGSAMKQQSRSLTIGSSPLKPSITAVIGAIENAISPPTSAALVQMASGTFPKSRPTLIWEILDQARVARALIKIVTSLRTVNSMLITRLAAPRSLADGTGITFNVNLEQIRLVSSKTVAAPQPTEARGMIQASAGSKATTPTDDATDKQASSILIQSGEGLGFIDDSDPSS